MGYEITPTKLLVRYVIKILQYIETLQSTSPKIPKLLRKLGTGFLLNTGCFITIHQPVQQLRNLYRTKYLVQLATSCQHYSLFYILNIL
jgi:hypothetical protein